MIQFNKTDQGIYEVHSQYKNIRIGTVAKTANSIDYSKKFNIIRNDEKNLLESLTKFEKKNIIFLNQMHKDNIIILNNIPATNSNNHGDADGIITSKPGICLVIRTADCVPVFIFDNKNKIIGAVHSGWRSTKLNISKKIIEQMNKLYSSEPEDLSAFILPSIGPESYEVNEDVSKFFKNDSNIKNNKIYVNLWQNIENSLMTCGLLKKNIFNTNLCNLKNCKEYFSHRHGDSGRNLNFGYIT